MQQHHNPLLVGSVKANISHLEAAGGISGLIKTVLAIRHGVIPPQAHFEEPSPHIPWKRLPVRIIHEATEWPQVEQRIAGVTALASLATIPVLRGPAAAAAAAAGPAGATPPKSVWDVGAKPDYTLSVAARKMDLFGQKVPATQGFRFHFSLLVRYSPSPWESSENGFDQNELF